ncbi:MAG: TolC family protein, partial [Gammaproteobacteria bacterium]|nr:TolC family protein [Gammaproteobacteria bacterium]
MPDTVHYTVRRQGIHRYLWILLALLLMTGCTTVPVRDSLAVEVPSGFSASGEDVLQDRWWVSFGDPVLNDLVERALAQNFSLQGVWARLDQAAAVERISSAALYPSLDIDGNAGRTWTDTGAGTANSFALGAMAGYEVDLWGRIGSGSRAAALDRQVGEAELVAAAISLSAEVAGTWYQLVEQYGQQVLVSNQLESNSRVLELITLRFRRGKVGATDVLQQRQLVESNRGEQANVQSQIGVLEHRLAILLGESPDVRVAEPRHELIDVRELPATGIPAELVRRRPDLRQRFYSLQAADQRTAAAVADRFPRISLQGSSDTTASDASDLFSNWLGNLSANLVAPVIDGGRRR